MIARATVRPPTPESNTPIARSSLIGGRLPPERLRDLLLRLLELGRPGLRREVLPAAVGEEAHDVGVVQLRRDPPVPRPATKCETSGRSRTISVPVPS